MPKKSVTARRALAARFTPLSAGITETRGRYWQGVRAERVVEERRQAREAEKVRKAAARRKRA
jgi:hypothetical protein